MVNFIVPLFYLLILDLASFFISEARGEKLGFKITILLSISVLLLILKDLLPSTEDNLPMIGESRRRLLTWTESPGVDVSGLRLQPTSAWASSPWWGSASWRPWWSPSCPTSIISVVANPKTMQTTPWRLNWTLRVTLVNSPFEDNLNLNSHLKALLHFMVMP